MIWLIILGILAYYSYRYLYAQDITKDGAPPQSTTDLPAIPRVEVPKTTSLSPRDQIAGIVESLDWCNDITRICWPYIGKIVQAELAPTIEPLINLYLPKPFSAFKFLSADLGKDPLTVDRVIVHRRYHNSIALDLDVSFKGTPNMSMKCSPLLAPFGIKELIWEGRLSVLLRPLIHTFPLIGAVQVAMISHPKIEMNFSGIAEFADFGPIERIVRKVLKDVIASMVVLPNRFLYKMTDAIDYFDVYFPPLGVLVVTIEKGRGFTKEKKMGMIKQIPDLYCKASFGLEDMKTDVRMNNLNPEWNQSKSFILSDLEQPFELKCYDKDTVTKDDLVGSIVMTAKELLAKESEWIPFQDNIDEKIAKNAEVLLKSQSLIFNNPCNPVIGQCVVTVLIDRAFSLPPKTTRATCRVRIGSHALRETPQVSRPSESIPGIDPVNPIWSFSFDVLCDRLSDADVVMEVLAGKTSLGRVSVSAHELNMSNSKEARGNYPLAGGASLRAKVILRGLVQDRKFAQ